MKASRFVAKNTFLMTLGLFTGRLMGFFILRRLAGLAGTTGIGIWGTAVDLASIILTVANFGLATLVTREVIKNRDATRSVFFSALRIKLFLGFGSYLAMVAYVYSTGYDDLTRQSILIMALGVLVEVVAMACDSVLQAHEKVQYQTYSQLVSAVVYIGLGWWSLSVGYGVMGVLWSNVASRLARLMIILPMMLLRTGPWRSRVSTEVGTWAMARMGLPIFLSTTFGIISFKIDTVMIMEILGKSAAGIYTIGHRPLDLLLLAPYTFSMAMFPSLQRYHEDGRTGSNTDLIRLSERSLRYMHVVFFPICIFCVLAAEPLIALLANNSDFGPSAGVFRIVIWGLPLQAATTIYNRVLMATGNEKVFITIGFAAMISNVTLNLLLIPLLKWNGAAATTVFSLLISYLLHRWYVRRAGVAIPTRRGLAGGTSIMLAIWLGLFLISSLLPPSWHMALYSLPFAQGWLAPIVLTVVALIIYMALILRLGIIDRNDLRMLRAILPERKAGL